MFSQGLIPDPSFPVRIIVEIDFFIRVEFFLFIAFPPFAFIIIILISCWVVI